MTTTEPMANDPMATEPTTTESATTESATTEPATTEPAETEEKYTPVPLPGLENIFLEIERPSRLMYVCALWLFDRPLTASAVLEQLHILVENPEFIRYKLVPRGGTRWNTPRWEQDENWDLSYHLSIHTLTTGTTAELQTFIAEVFTEPFDYNRPLWSMHLIHGVGESKEECALFWRAHHTLADGQGFVRSLLSCTSAKAEIDELIQQTKDLYNAPLKPSQLPGLARLPNAESLPQWFLRIYAGILFFFVYIFSVVIGSIHGTYMGLKGTFSKRKSLVYDGPQNVKKQIAWSDTISIDDIRVVRKAYGATLNDVMMATITRCIRHTLLTHDALLDKELMLLIPVSLRHPTDWSFRNLTGASWAWTPLTDLPARQLLKAIKREMNGIKGSVAPRFTLNWSNTVYRLPAFISQDFFTTYSDKSHGVLTNIPGPKNDIYFAGEKIKQYRALPPQTGKGALAIGLLSYAGNISVSVMCDDMEEMPNLANDICGRFVEEFGRFVEEARAEALGAEDKKMQ